MVHTTVYSDATEKLQGTFHLFWIIKNAYPREDQVAPRQAKKKTITLIIEWLNCMHRLE